MALATSIAQAQMAPPPAAPAAAPAANAVDPASIQALKDMGAHLQTPEALPGVDRADGERVLADGQKLQHTATAKLDVERPNKCAP